MNEEKILTPEIVELVKTVVADTLWYSENQWIKLCVSLGRYTEYPFAVGNYVCMKTDNTNTILVIKNIDYAIDKVKAVSLFGEYIYKDSIDNIRMAKDSDWKKEIGGMIFTASIEKGNVLRLYMDGKIFTSGFIIDRNYIITFCKHFKIPIRDMR